MLNLDLMFRVFIFALFCITHLSSLSQGKGSLKIQCVHYKSNAPLSGLLVEISSDSINDSGIINSNGEVLFSDLDPGNYEIVVCDVDQLSKARIFIQSKQLLQYTMPIDTANATLREIRSDRYEVSPNGQLEEKNSQSDVIFDHQPIHQSFTINQSSNISSQNLEEIYIIAYKQPLIDLGSSAQVRTVTREDIQQLPRRSISKIATTVGGVNEINEGELSIRGTRVDANMFFIDGVKVRGASQLPKSYLGEVQVLTGGIPANYGDVLGGVINVRSRNINMRALPRTSYTITDKKEEPEPFAPVVNYDHFIPIYENQFLSPMDHPHATFGLDVDQAAWSYVKSMARKGFPIKRDAVKMEEMINAFSYQEISVPEKEWANVKIERSACSWNKDHELVSVHLKVRDYPKDRKRKPHNFVFLIDVSGSMSSMDKLPLVVQGLKDLVNKLRPEDRISIVTYASGTGVPLPSTTCENKRKIFKALEDLSAGGSTNGMGGVQQAYHQAELYFDSTYNNRIILATDGDFNVGVNSIGGLEKYISTKRGQGIYLTALGFGMGNYKNSTLETLAKRGDGNHFYIETRSEMESVFADPGNLNNALRDVKLDVQFNPRLISDYRLIGYENRLLKPQDFEDDTKDGGELGYGHEVTAVFEIAKGKASKVESHFVKTRPGFGKQELAFVKLRYKPLEQNSSLEKRYSLPSDQEVRSNELLNLVVAFGLELRDSAFKGDLSHKLLVELAKEYNPKNDEEKDLVELIGLVSP